MKSVGDIVAGTAETVDLDPRPSVEEQSPSKTLVDCLEQVPGPTQIHLKGSVPEPSSH